MDTITDWMPTLLNIGRNVIGLVIVWVLFFIVKRWIPRLVEELIELRRDPEQARQLSILTTFLNWALVAIAGLITLSLLGLTSIFYSLLATAGAAGIVIGFAVKDVASNLVSGVFLLVDQPFVIGDVIETARANGTVKNVSLRSTEVLTESGALVSIPNSLLSTAPVTNFTIQENRQLELSLTLPRETDLAALEVALKEAVASEPRVLDGDKAMVVLRAVQEQALQVSCLVRVANEDWLDVQSDLRQAAMAALQKHDVPFNTLT